MARPSKLTTVQCARIRELKNRAESPISAVNLAKMFKVSESSIYKVLDGSYIARPASAGQPAVVAASKPAGAMPSIFEASHDSGNREAPRRRSTDIRDIRTGSITELVEKAAKADFEQPVDELTLAAARLLVARARFNEALAHTN